MAAKGSAIVYAQDVNNAFIQQVIDVIQYYYPIEYSRNGPYPFPDTKEAVAGWPYFFERLQYGTYTPLGSGEARVQSWKIDSEYTINAQGIRDAYIGHASLELTRFRMLKTTRTVTASGSGTASSSSVTGIAGRFTTNNRAPGYTSPSSTYNFNRGTTINATTILNWMDDLATEWDRVSVVDRVASLAYSVCHNQCHNNCHGSRGRR